MPRRKIGISRALALELAGSMKLPKKKIPSFVAGFREAEYIPIPKILSATHIDEFLLDVEYIFRNPEKHDIVIDLSRTRDIDLIGFLSLYKFLCYTKQNNIVRFGILNETTNLELRKKMHDTGFQEAFNEVVNYGKYEIDGLKRIESNALFIYPQYLSRTSSELKIRIEDQFISKINDFYLRHNNPHSIHPAAKCMAEIVSNFMQHAINDKDTIITARGTPNDFRIAIADNGFGIVSNLRKHLPGVLEKDILSYSLKKGITSKTNLHNMGYGLFLVSELAKVNLGRLDIWSEGYAINVTAKTVKTRKCGFWKGTLLHLQLNLSNPKGISEIPDFINFIPKIPLTFI